MSDKVVMTIDMTPEEHQHIEDLAHEHGYDSPGEYLLSLVDIADDEEDDLTKEELLANFRQGWQEAMRGEVYPIETLWDDLDDE